MTAMSEHEGDSRWMGPFVLGFVLGILVCLGVGGSLVAMMYSRGRMEAELARQAEMEARDAAEQARQRLEEERRVAEQHAAKARAQLKKQIKDAKARASSSKEDVARARAMVLDKAIQAYAVNHNGEYPASVDVLTQPDAENNNKPYVNEGSIIDPWGDKYLIDPSGARNKGAKADVFTVSPDGKVIGNFPSPSTKPKREQVEKE
jgi:type II secretory pathway pseudopilin PulG